MLDPKRLLEQMFNSNIGTRTGQTLQGARERLNGVGGAQGFAGGAVTGGLLGLLLGNRKMRKAAGGVLGYGGAAVLGALAHRAYQNYTEGRPLQTVPTATPEDITGIPRSQLPHTLPGTDGRPFELVLIEAMVAAAKADGHVDADEQKRLFAEVERRDLEADSKAYVFDLLAKPTDLSKLAVAVSNPEQAGEVYLAARLAIDPDQPTERAFLDGLASELRLSKELRAHLEHQVGI
jgi:uncharacterized membrane protein YebE (DUF533 family)